jgi:hypothetical protein
MYDLASPPPLFSFFLKKMCERGGNYFRLFVCLLRHRRVGRRVPCGKLIAGFGLALQEQKAARTSLGDHQQGLHETDR